MSTFKSQSTYYEILEVAPEAAHKDIYTAYQRARATYAQDNPALYSMFTPEEARDLSRLIEEAYSVLGNQALRKSYDETLKHSGHNSEWKPPVSAMNSARYGQAAEAAHPVQSARADLPDIKSHMTVLEENSEFVVKKKDMGANLPPGTGRTLLTTYKIDQNFEKQIAATTDYEGAFLKKVRLYKGLTLEAMSENTRVSRTYLAAVEDQDRDNLPAPVFVRGFVVQYARLIGLDENKVANSYMKILKGTDKK